MKEELLNLKRLGIYDISRMTDSEDVSNQREKVVIISPSQGSNHIVESNAEIVSESANSNPSDSLEASNSKGECFSLKLQDM